MNLRQALPLRFPAVEPARLPGGFDQVGDIAVIGITPEAKPFEGEIGAVLIALHNTLRVVAKRDGQHAGEYRTRSLRVIAGEHRLTTVHRENGVTLHLDLGQVYFSVRSAHERARIAALVQPDETVAVLCSGIGPFPLTIGLHSKARQVIGIEKNPVAHAYAQQNLTINRTINTVHFFQGDANLVLPELNEKFDRILVAMPHGGETLLPCALDALRPGGTLHYYAMQTKGCHKSALASVTAICLKKERFMLPLQTVVCGRCGPAVDRICLDAVIGPAG